MPVESVPVGESEVTVSHLQDVTRSISVPNIAGLFQTQSSHLNLMYHLAVPLLLAHPPNQSHTLL